MSRCKTPGCGSYAINHNCHGRDGSDGDLCDVCYWRKREKTNQGRITQLEAALVVAREALQPAAVSKPLTYEQIENIWKKWVATQRPNYSFARAIESAIRGE